MIQRAIQTSILHSKHWVSAILLSHIILYHVLSFIFYFFHPVFPKGHNNAKMDSINTRWMKSYQVLLTLQIFYRTSMKNWLWERKRVKKFNAEGKTNACFFLSHKEHSGSQGNHGHIQKMWLFPVLWGREGRNGKGHCQDGVALPLCTLWLFEKEHSQENEKIKLGHIW